MNSTSVVTVALICRARAHTAKGETGMHEMLLPAEPAQHATGLGHVGRLAEDAPLDDHHGVGADDPGLGMGLGDLPGLGLGKGADMVRRRRARRPALIHLAGDYREAQPGLFQQVAPPR